MKVLKFGGSSLGNAARIRAVAALAAASGKNLVVLSAMAGTTDTLAEIALYLFNRNLEAARETASVLEKKYLSVVEELLETQALRDEAAGYVREVFTGIDALSRAYFTEVQERVLLAQGEMLSSFLLTACLREKGVEARLVPALSFMRLDRQGEPDLAAIRSLLEKALAEAGDAPLYVTEGYICVNARDEVDNLRRGGSDYTACLAGAALQAEEIQIWTDVDGLQNNHPGLVKHTAPVRHLNFEEAAELAYFGAKILHPTCILPARYAHVPVRLLNTLDPSAPGTLIDNVTDPGAIKAVAAKDNIVAIKIKSSRMLLAHGFLRRVFEIFESYRTPIDMICTSEVGVSLTIDDTRYLGEIVHDLKKYGAVSVDLDMCIVCVVGDMDWNNRGYESRVMEALEDIPVRMVSYGGSNYNISLLVREEDKARTLNALSEKLFS